MRTTAPKEQFTEDIFYLDGTGQYGCETFIYDRTAGIGDESPHHFTKVNYYPYASAVCVALMVLKDHLQDDVRILSDDDFSDSSWKQARQLYYNIFVGRPVAEYFRADNPDHNTNPANLTKYHIKPSRLIANEISFMLECRMGWISTLFHRLRYRRMK